MQNKFRCAKLTSAIALLALLAAVPACKQNASVPEAEKPAPQQMPVMPPSPGPAAVPSGPPNQVAGIAWTIPSGWEIGAARQMRIATYRIRAVAGDPEDAECAVFFFGPGQGGAVDSNIERWVHQFTAPDGTSPVQSAITDKRDIAGLKVSTLTVSGTYLAGAGTMPGQQEVKKPKFRMRAAIIEAPQGMVFLKLIGPLNTVAGADSDFNTMLGSLHRQ
jgi:hypothetical protein